MPTERQPPAKPAAVTLSDPPVPGPGSVILACEMIEDEVLVALDRVTGPPIQGFRGGPRADTQATAERVLQCAAERPTVVWIESGLHERPQRLRDHIQKLVDLLDEASAAEASARLPSVRPGRGPSAARSETITIPPDRLRSPGPLGRGVPGAGKAEHRTTAGGRDILLALGYCGNALDGLVSRRHRLVFPRVDDCISLFLNRGCSREEIVRDAHAFYLTKGWLCHDNPVKESLSAWSERFGREKARELRRSTMAAYERVTLIDTGAFDVSLALPDSLAFAEELELAHTGTQGSIVLLQRLFEGAWDSEIVVVPPGEAISLLHLLGPQ